MKKFIEKYKISLTIIIGSLSLFAGLYAPVMSSFLLTKEKHDFTTVNYVLIAIAIVFLFGSVKAIAQAIQKKVSGKINTDNNLQSKNKDGAVTPNKGF